MDERTDKIRSDDVIAASNRCQVTHVGFRSPSGRNQWEELSERSSNKRDFQKTTPLPASNPPEIVEIQFDLDNDAAMTAQSGSSALHTSLMILANFADFQGILALPGNLSNANVAIANPPKQWAGNSGEEIFVFSLKSAIHE